MNRQPPGAPRQTASQSQPMASYHRAAQGSPAAATSANPMFYATAGAQTTSSGQAPPQASSRVPGSYASATPRGGPPGFASRAGGDQGDFPALGSHATSSYASQAQPGQYMSQQQLPAGLQPPGPPPGLSAPGSAGGGTSGSQAQTNGTREESLGASGGGGGGEDFPALGGATRGGGPGSVVSDGKDRMAAFMRNPGQHTQAPPSPPTALPNGASGSHTHSNSATPSQHMGGAGAGLAQSTTGSVDPSWLRQAQSPSRGLEQITRPVQQILTSPVDQWGLQALLYEIKMGKPDRQLMMHGEDLSDLGVDINSDEPLYPTFVTPWLAPAEMSHPLSIEERYQIPSCYMVTAPPMSSKLTYFAEDTLFYVFYSQPQDVAQLEVAEELYNRGWRYHTPTQTWMSSPLLANFDPRDTPPTADTPFFHGPFIVFDQHKFQRLPPQNLSLSPTDFEATRTANSIVAEENARKESLKSPNGSAAGQPVPVR